MEKRNSVFNLCSILLIGCFGNNLMAQSGQRYVSLNDALQTAEKNYPLLKAKNWNVKSAEEHLVSTKDEVLIPALKLHEQIDYATSNGVQGTYFSYGISTSGGLSAMNNYTPVYGSVSLASLEWVPFSFGQSKSRIELSKIELKSTMLDADNEKFQHQIRVADVYLSLAAFHQLTSVAQSNLQRAQEIKTATTALAKSGLRPGVDSSFVNSEMSKAILDLNESQKNEVKEKIILANLIGDENTNFSIDTATFYSKEPSILNDTSISSLPLVKLFQSRIDFSRTKEKLIGRSYFPKIYFLSGVWGRGSGMGVPAGTVSDASFAGGTKLSRYDYAVGVACTFNILDFPRVHSQLLSQKALTSASTEEYNQLMLDARSNLAVANAQIEFAKKQKQEAPVQYDAANNAFIQSKARYESGLATLPEVSQSLYVLSRAASDKVIANNNLWRALLQKAASTGILSEFTSQIK